MELPMQDLRRQAWPPILHHKSSQLRHFQDLKSMTNLLGMIGWKTTLNAGISNIQQLNRYLKCSKSTLLCFFFCISCYLYPHLCMHGPSVSRTEGWLSSGSRECWSRASDSWHSAIRAEKHQKVHYNTINMNQIKARLHPLLLRLWNYFVAVNVLSVQGDVVSKFSIQTSQSKLGCMRVRGSTVFL